MTITKDLTKLQKQMKALSGAKCPVHWHGHDHFYTDGTCTMPECDEHLNSCSGLDPKYDCLRVKCFWEPTEPHAHQEIQVENCVDKNWWTLPAERAHEAVGKLLILAEPLTRNNLGQWFVGVKRISEPWHDTPEEALISALCEAEGVSDG